MFTPKKTKSIWYGSTVNNYKDYQLKPERLRTEIDNLSAHVLWQQDQLDMHKAYIVLFTIVNIIILGVQLCV